MPFEVALVLSMLVHLAIFTAIQLVWLIRFRPVLAHRSHFWWRLAFAGFFWIGCIEVFDGCPFTHVENQVAEWAYGRPFYENYGKADTYLYNSVEGSDAQP